VGPQAVCGACAGKGGKHTFWDGGVRVVSFVSGPIVPAKRRGGEFWGLAHVSPHPMAAACLCKRRSRHSS
jgi:hypothetical protein